MDPHNINFPDDPDPLARYRREYEQREEELARQRRDADRFVTKTIDHARVSAPEPAPAPDEFTGDVIIEAVGQVIGQERRDFQAALARRDREISRETKSLWREIKLLRDEVALERGLANFKVEAEQARQQARDRELESLRRELVTLRHEVELKLKLKRELAAARNEIEELRQRAPSFESELAGLREQVAKQQKTISKLRVENSLLTYGQQQLDAQLSQMRRNAAAPAAVVQFETSSSRITVGNLHPDAANALRQFASQVVDAYDGDPILFSGLVGTA